MKFDDFNEIDGDLIQEFFNLSKRRVKIFLNKIGSKKVDELSVLFETKPFLEILFGFRINGQVVILDSSYIKQKKLKEDYDSCLAQIFSEFDEKQIKEFCEKLKKELNNVFVK